MIIAAQRILELGIAKRNEAWARSRGAKEYGKEHYWMFFVLHPAWILSILLEGSIRNPVSPAWWAVIAYVLLQFARYSIIKNLGNYWNTKILIVPSGVRINSGWYSFIKHPNYVVVALELLITPFVVGAFWTALVFTLLNALVMWVRIPLEERVLQDHYRV
jgi:methyltransferase